MPFVINNKTIDPNDTQGAIEAFSKLLAHKPDGVEKIESFSLVITDSEDQIFKFDKKAKFTSQDWLEVSKFLSSATVINMQINLKFQNKWEIVRNQDANSIKSEEDYNKLECQDGWDNIIENFIKPLCSFAAQNTQVSITANPKPICDALAWFARGYEHSSEESLQQHGHFKTFCSDGGYQGAEATTEKAPAELDGPLPWITAKSPHNSNVLSRHGDYKFNPGNHM